MAINMVREKNNLPPLELDSDISWNAGGHAAYISETQKVQEAAPYCLQGQQEMRDLCFRGITVDPKEIMESIVTKWRKSQNEESKILNPNARLIGVGSHIEERLTQNIIIVVVRIAEDIRSHIAETIAA